MFLNGKKDGKGLILYKNGAKYEGEIKNNLHNGFGKLTQLDGEIFIGQWKNGKINGKGVRYHSNGDVYSGDYVNSIRDGIGKMYFSMEIHMKIIGKNGKLMEKVISSLEMEIYMKDISKIIVFVVKDSLKRKLEKFILENLKMVYWMEKELK